MPPKSYPAVSHPAVTAPVAPATEKLNGISVPALKQTVAAIEANPQAARFNFRVTNKWLGGDRNRTTMKEFTGALARHRTDAPPFVYDNGEPAVLLGQDKAPNPAEWLLHALIGCITTSIAWHAAASGIEIRSISSAVDGDIDLRGFLGLSDTVRKGYAAIRVRLTIGTDATPEQIEPLARMSPVLDVVSRSVPVAIMIDTI